MIFYLWICKTSDSEISAVELQLLKSQFSLIWMLKGQNMKIYAQTWTSMQATEAGGEWLHTSLVQFQRFVYSNFCETLPFLFYNRTHFNWRIWDVCIHGCKLINVLNHEDPFALLDSIFFSFAYHASDFYRIWVELILLLYIFSKHKHQVHLNSFSLICYIYQNAKMYLKKTRHHFVTWKLHTQKPELQILLKLGVLGNSS